MYNLKKMILNDYHKKRNEEIIKAIEEQQKNPLTMEQVREQFKRIREGRINKDKPQ